MSKQIALVIDNSGSMFAPVGGANPNSKIHEAAEGARQFIQNLVDRMAAMPGSQFAFSVHRFASSYQILPGAAQVDSGAGAGFTTALNAIRNTHIAQVENEAASQAAIGSMTDLYDGIRRTSDYMIANNPSFGAPGSRVIVLFSDGIQTITHGGGTTMGSYEAAAGLSFSSLLNARGIKFIGWGVGTDALGTVLADLVAQAVSGGTNPVSSSKVLFPYNSTPNCTTTILNAAHAVVDNNGVLPLRPTWRPPTGLLWEQFSLPRPAPSPGHVPLTHAFVPYVNFADFEVDVDGVTRELILSLVSFRPTRATITATSPSGTAFTDGSPGTRTLGGPTVRTLKIETPEEGTWRVRVDGGDKPEALTFDLMARGVCRELSLEVRSEPHQIPAPGKAKVVAIPRLDGKRLEGKLAVSALVLGGASYDLDLQPDGSFSGTVEVMHHGRNPIRAQLSGKTKDGRSVRRVEFAVVQVGPALDPRFRITPDVYEQGRQYTVALTLVDGQFGHASSLRVGTGIAVTRFEVLNEHQAEADISVEPAAFIGTREAVLFAPMAESQGVVRVVEGKGGHGRPPGSHGDHQGRICCLRFDADGRLVAVVMCDGPTICVRHHDERIRRLLETARDQGLNVTIHVDARGCLVAVDVCR